MYVKEQNVKIQSETQYKRMIPKGKPELESYIDDLDFVSALP